MTRTRIGLPPPPALYSSPSLVLEVTYPSHIMGDDDCLMNLHVSVRLVSKSEPPRQPLPAILTRIYFFSVAQT